APEPELALLDGAFQVALLWQLETAPLDGLPIPFSIERLTVYRALSAGCSVVVTAMAEGAGSARTTAVTIADAQGRVCLRVSGFTALVHRPKQHPACLFAKRVAEVGPADRADGRRAEGPRPSACVFGSDTLLRAIGAPIDVHKPPPGGAVARGAAPFAVIVETGREGWETDLEHASNIAKALMQQAAPEPVRLLLVRLVSPEQSPDALALGSALGAFNRSLRLEDPRLHVSAVGFRVAAGGGWFEPGLANALARLVRSEDVAPEIEIDLATGRIATLQVAPIQAPAAPAPYREQGVYLVTGGLGGVGRLIAADLAARYHARVVVCGRSLLDASTQALLAELRATGGEGEIVYLAADVADQSAVRVLLDAVRSRFGRIDGVFHGAGVLRDGLLAYASPDKLLEVVQPKVLGAYFLDIETRSDALDFFVLFSSLVATTGNAGQSAYAFANGWLEGFARARVAERREGRRQGITVAVGFGPWRSQGMKLPPAVEKRLAERHGLSVFDASGGVIALQRAIATGEPNVIVASGDAVRLGEWLCRGTERRERETGEQPMPNQDIRARAMDLIVSAIAEEAKLQPNEIDRTARFEDYGIDSMMIMSLTERLEESLGALPKTLFFEHRTVAELADHLARVHAASLAGKAPSPAAAHDHEHAASAPKAAIPAPKTQVSVSSSSTPAESAQMTISKADEDIAIIGVHGRFAESDDLDEFWENLKTGRDCISEVPPERWDHHLVVPPGDESVGLSSGFRWGGFLRDAFAFDPRFFRMSKREAEMIDPQERLFLMSAYHCLEDAGYPGATLAGAEVGVFAGVMWGQYEMWGLE
ncbi:MAG TPA: SDR family NAD(P)-dependent oxidoreductase, partial [Candidatus Eisenbacteria bacterium]|nr:SDR family NAD(P)-dependent oxidoreductase [Candidatus Eisenbacteria bacterium]